MKTKIKKIAYGMVSMGVLAPMIALGAVATPTGGFDPTLTGASGLAGTDFSVVLVNVLNWLLGIIATLGVIGFVIAGIFYLTAAGDDTKMETGKKAMTYAIIGIAVALLGLIAVNTISGILRAGQ